MGDRQHAQVVEEWRAAEAWLATRDPDAAVFEDITRAIARLRAEYRRLGTKGLLGASLDARNEPGNAA